MDRMVVTLPSIDVVWIVDAWDASAGADDTMTVWWWRIVSRMNPGVYCAFGAAYIWGEAGGGIAFVPCGRG